MNHIINNDELEKDLARGLEYYGIAKSRAKELAWANVTFVAEEMYECQDEVTRAIVSQEKWRIKGLKK